MKTNITTQTSSGILQELLNEFWRVAKTQQYNLPNPEVLHIVCNNGHEVVIRAESPAELVMWTDEILANNLL